MPVIHMRGFESTLFDSCSSSAAPSPAQLGGAIAVTCSIVVTTALGGVCVRLAVGGIGRRVEGGAGAIGCG